MLFANPSAASICGLKRDLRVGGDLIHVEAPCFARVPLANRRAGGEGVGPVAPDLDVELGSSAARAVGRRCSGTRGSTLPTNVSLNGRSEELRGSTRRSPSRSTTRS